MLLVDEVKNILRPVYHRLKKEPHLSIHWAHAKLLDGLFGKPEMYKILGRIPNTLIRQLLEEAQKGGVRFEQEQRKRTNNLLINELSAEQIKRLNNDLEVILISSDFCRIIINWIFKSVRDYSKSPLVVCNIRAWITRPGVPRRGPNEVHTDGFFPGHFKVMVYLTGLSKASGMLLLGNEVVTNQKPGTVVAFRNSDIPHSGIPGDKNERVVIEITFLRSLFTDISICKREFNGRHFENLFKVYKDIARDRLREWVDRVFLRKLNRGIVRGKDVISSLILRRFKGDRVYLGSGRCDWKNWKCFDIVSDPNVVYLKFSPEFVLPIERDSCELIYSSHNLEHLDSQTVARLISQSYEKLKIGAQFVLKIPNFSYLIESYRSGNLTEINDSGVLDVMHTWHNKGVLPTLENKISMVFCGYTDTAYGKHFQGTPIGSTSGGYHGPAVVPAEDLKNILLNKEINEISRLLNQAACSDKDFLEFNHQNAWSNKEVIELFLANGYRLISCDRYQIIKRYRGIIPDIKKFFEQSSYFLFSKP